MDKEILQENLKRLMQEKGYNMKSLSLAAGLNETAVRDILKSRVASPTYATLNRLAKILKCSVEDLTSKNDLTNLKLFSNEDIQIELFTEAVIKVDYLIQKYKINVLSEVKARVYLACYQLILLNKTSGNIIDSEPLVKILKLNKK
ncbi:MAG: helix-turn-helix domain-containing protein [Alphaproteobacteria bacterium]